MTPFWGPWIGGPWLDTGRQNDIASLGLLVAFILWVAVSMSIAALTPKPKRRRTS